MLCIIMHHPVQVKNLNLSSLCLHFIFSINSYNQPRMLSVYMIYFICNRGVGIHFIFLLEIHLKYAYSICEWFENVALFSDELTRQMCTTRGEGILTSIQHRKECVESKLVISCSMIHNSIGSKYTMLFKS